MASVGATVMDLESGDDGDPPVTASYASLAWFLRIGGGGPHRQAPAPPTPEELLAHASTAKTEGNAHYGGGRYRRAECCYTEAISLLDLLASVFPPGAVPRAIVGAATELELVCASNRAQSYLRLGLAGEALDDCYRALAERFDRVLLAKRPLHKKLLLRKAQAHRELGDLQGVIATIEVAEQIGLGTGDELEQALRNEPDPPQQPPSLTLKVDAAVRTMIGTIRSGADFTAETARATLPAEVNARDSSGNSCIDVAAVMLGGPFGAEAAGAVRVLATNLGVEVNHKIEAGKTPLMFAASSPVGVDAVAALITAGADTSAADDQGYTALMVALSSNSPAVGLLLDHASDADLRACTSDGFTPLMFAAQQGIEPVVLQILRRGVPLGHRDHLLGYSAYTFAKQLSEQGPSYAACAAAIRAAAAGDAKLEACMAMDDECLAFLQKYETHISPIVKGSCRPAAPRDPDGRLGAEDDARVAGMEDAIVRALFDFVERSPDVETTKPNGNPYLVLFEAMMVATPDIIYSEYARGSDLTDDERAWLQMCPGGVTTGEQQDWLIHRGEHSATHVLALHSEFLTLVPRVYQVFANTLRDPMTHTFAFAIPNEEALQTILRHQPVIEMGAGTGYWCKLLRDRGADIVAYDLNPPTKDLENAFFSEVYTEVIPGDTDVVAGNSNRTLFLCWPNHEGHSNDWDARCLKSYTGDTVIHVGELRGHCRVGLHAPIASPDGVGAPLGVTTSSGFQDLLEVSYELINSVAVPKWPFATDKLTVWRRRPTVSPSGSTAGR